MTTAVIPGLRDRGTGEISDENKAEVASAMSVIQNGIHVTRQGVWTLHVPFGGTAFSDQTSSALLRFQVRSAVEDLDELRLHIETELLLFEDTPFRFSVSSTYRTVQGGASVEISIKAYITPA